MIKLIIFFTLLFHHYIKCQSSTVSTSLYLVDYEPNVKFRLSFSQPIQRPQFQILLNNINLTYVFVTQSNFTDVYDLSLMTNIDALDPNVQCYSLLFTYPLNVANGKLNLADYILEPEKASVLLQLPVWPGYILFALIYTFSLFGIIGLKLIDFIQMFILAEYQFKHTTTIYQFLGNSYFIRTQADTHLDQSYIIRLCAPLFILLGIFLVCFIVKMILKNTQSLYLQQVRQFFVYNLFLSAWSVFCMPIFYNACQYFTLSTQNLLLFTVKQKSLCILITYLNFLTTFLYLYLMWFTINPKPFEDPQIYNEYLRSDDFKQFEKFYIGLHFKTWHNKNYAIFLALRKLSVVFLFFRVTFIAEIILFQQILVMFYVFTARPFKQQFYVISSITINLLFFFCFLVLVQGNLYFNMSDIINTQLSINDYLMAKNIILKLVSLTFLIFAGIQNFKIFSNIRYKIKLFSQAKDDENIDLNSSIARKRLYTQSSASNSIRKKFANKNRLTIPQLDNISTVSTIFKKPSLNRQTSQIHHSSSKAKLNLFQIEMQELSSPSIFRNRLKSSSSPKIKHQQMKELKLINHSDVKVSTESQSFSPTKNNINKSKSSKSLHPQNTIKTSNKKESPNNSKNAQTNSTKKQKQRWKNKGLLQQLADNKKKSPKA